MELNLLTISKVTACYSQKVVKHKLFWTMNCELCERELERLTVHHLIPRQKVKQKKADAGPTVKICSACHRQIHILFDNKRLAQELNTLEKLSDEPSSAKVSSLGEETNTS